MTSKKERPRTTAAFLRYNSGVRLFFGVSLGLFLVFILLLIFLPDRQSRPHPADEDLIANFNAHEAEFEQLLNMCREDSQMARIGNDFLWKAEDFGWPREESDWGISRERWDAYKDLFARVKLDSGLVNRQPDSVLFLASSRGWAPSGSHKGYAYLAKPPDKTFDSLDHSNGITDNEVYRSIKGNWYLWTDQF